MSIGFDMSIKYVRPSCFFLCRWCDVMSFWVDIDECPWWLWNIWYVDNLTQSDSWSCMIWYMVISHSVNSSVCLRYDDLCRYTLCLTSTMIHQVLGNCLVMLRNTNIKLSMMLVMNSPCMDDVLLLTSHKKFLHGLCSDTMKLIRYHLIGDPCDIRILGDNLMSSGDWSYPWTYRLCKWDDVFEHMLGYDSLMRNTNRACSVMSIWMICSLTIIIFHFLFFLLWLDDQYRFQIGYL